MFRSSRSIPFPLQKSTGAAARVIQVALNALSLLHACRRIVRGSSNTFKNLVWHKLTSAFYNQCIDSSVDVITATVTGYDGAHKRRIKLTWLGLYTLQCKSPFSWCYLGDAFLKQDETVADNYLFALHQNSSSKKIAKLCQDFSGVETLMFDLPANSLPSYQNLSFIHRYASALYYISIILFSLSRSGFSLGRFLAN